MPTAGATSPVKGQRKTKVGRVVSDKMDKTIVVSVERLTRHRLYKRVMRASTKFAAHDERNEAKIVSELNGVQGKPVEIGGYYHPDPAQTAKAMRPSATFNAIIGPALRPISC